MLNMFKYINMFLWFIINRIWLTIFSQIGDICFGVSFLPSSLYLAATHLLPSPLQQTDSPCFQGSLYPFVSVLPVAPVLKAIPPLLGCHCSSSLPSIPQNVSLWLFLFSFHFQLLSPYPNQYQKLLPCFQQRFLQLFPLTIATPFLPIIAALSHCCFFYISLLVSMSHIQ